MSYSAQPAPPGTSGSSASTSNSGAAAGSSSTTSSSNPTPTSAYGYGYNYQSYYGGYGASSAPPAAAAPGYPSHPPQQPGSYPYHRPQQQQQPGSYPGGQYAQQQQHQSPYAAYNAAYEQQQQQQQYAHNQQQQLAKQLQAFAKYDGRKRNYDGDGPGFGGSYDNSKRPRYNEYGHGHGHGSRSTFDDQAGFGGRGRGRNRGRGGGFGGGGRRSNYNDSMEGWQPLHSNTDTILTDKRFNFWNLPSKARVLLVSNLCANVAQPMALFNLFSFYGDVNRVKILRTKTNVALIEFETATMAAIARDHLDGCVVSGKKIVVSFSKFDKIHLPKDGNLSDDGHTQDFKDPTFKRLHRFANSALAKSNLKRITKPTSCVHVANVPANMSIDDVKKHFESRALQVNEVLSIEQKSKKSSKDGSNASDGKSDYNRLMCYFNMASISDAATAMALLNGSCADDQAAGLKLSFVATTIEEQKNRIKKDTKSNLVIIDSDKKASGGRGGNGEDNGNGAA